MSWKLFYANPDGTNEQNVVLEALGALEGGQVTGDGIRFTFSSHKASEVSISIPAVDPKNAPVIPFTGRVRLVDGKGVQQFVGRRIDWDGKASAENHGFTYQFQDAWWDLSKITYKQAWMGYGGYLKITYSGGVITFPYAMQVSPSGAAEMTANFYTYNTTTKVYTQVAENWTLTQTQTSPTTATMAGGTGAIPSTGQIYAALQSSFTDVVLFQYCPSAPYLNASEIVDYYITTGEQIVEILGFAISRGVNLQIGRIDPSLFVPWYPVRCQNCAEVLKICLRDHPDCFTEIDYTTTPPTFNVRQRANLTPKTLPYAYTDANGIQHVSTDVKPRPDLIPSRIGIFYRYMMNGSVISWPQDIWPVNAPDGLLALDYSIDLQGLRSSISFGQIISNPLPLPLSLAADAAPSFNPANENDWWLSKHKQLSNNDAYNISAGGAGNPAAAEVSGLAMCDSLGNIANPTVVLTTPDGTQFINSVPSGYNWEMIGGGQVLWMSGINAIPCTVKTWFNFKKNRLNADGTVSAASKESAVTASPVSVNVVLVNTASIQQSFSNLLASGQFVPWGLAQSIWESLQTMQYQLRQSQREEPFTDFIKPGKHCINLAGGNPAWAGMNATVQETSYTLRQRPDGVVWAMSEVSCGPVEHLEAGQLVQLFNIFANRDLAKIDPWERITGQSGGGGGGAVGTTSKENSVAGEPTHSQHSATDTITP